MEHDSVVEAIKNLYDKKLIVTGMRKIFTFQEGCGCVGFLMTVAYEITNIFRKSERIKVIVDIKKFDSWDLFKEDAKQAFLMGVKKQITDQIPGIEHILDISIARKGE